MQITIDMIKELREKTGCGIMDCRTALEKANGNMEAALEELREKGLKTAEKRADRVAAEGRLLRGKEEEEEEVLMETPSMISRKIDEDLELDDEELLGESTRAKIFVREPIEEMEADEAVEDEVEDADKEVEE